MVLPWAVAGGVMAGSAIANYLGGQAASQAEKDAMKEAARTFRESRSFFAEIGIPPIEAQRLVLQQYGLPEEFQPILEEAIELPQSALEEVSFDPRFQEARLDALAKLQGISEQEGMDLQAKVAMEQALGQARQEASAAQEAAMTSAQRRGIAGSGLEMAMAREGQQDAANRAREASQLQALGAQQRALEALAQGTGLAGELSQEDIALQTAKARAADSVNKFNTAEAIARQQRNVGAQNVAGLENLRGKEQVGRMNVDLLNQGQIHNKGLLGQQFTQEMQKAAGMAGQTGALGQLQAQSAPGKARTAAAPYQAGAEGISAFGDLYAQGKKEKWWEEEDEKKPKV